ncbi:MAG: hypothetical protein ABS52_18425 [Gemmatimonadetes bacterium SCN 70-22]|mgnify:FL=1|nr:MAG: hypothetical protein ABS52_18425 [Gemmatimonadetes bacterium SCN 70-22]
MSIPREYGPILDAVRGLTWPARRRVGGTHTGAHPSRLRGRAPELSEYRLYRQGDDPRQLDWKLLARSDRPFTRLADDRAVHPTWFLVDASASMAYPATTHAKWAMARALTVGLAAIAQRSGDPVGAAIVAAGGTAFVRARTRADVLLELMSALGSVTPSGSPQGAPALLQVPMGARLVVVSDLLGDEGALRRAAATRASARGDVHVLHVVARDELAPPPSVALAVDPEDPAIERPLDAVARAAYQARFAAWREETALAWRLSGAAYRQVQAEEDAALVVRAVATSAPAGEG